MLLYAGALLLPNFALLDIDPSRESAIKLAITLVMLVAWIAAFGKPRYAVLLSLPAFLLLPADLFFTVTYQEPPTAAVIGILANTNLGETLDYLEGRKLELAAAIVATIAIWAYAYRYLETPHLLRRTPSRWIGRVIIGGWVLALAMATTPRFSGVDTLLAGGNAAAITDRAALPFHLDKLRGVFPFGRASSFAEYYVGERNAALLQAKLRDFSFGVPTAAADSERQIYVLVIGEASRPDRWQIDGYGRPTNPFLSREPNLVTLTNVVSPWTWTLASVPVIVSRKPSTDHARFFTERTVVSLFHEAGFRTYWVSNQARQTGMGSPIREAAAEADEVRWMNVSANDVFGRGAYDEVLLGALRDILTRPEPRQFVVLHLLGSHDAYDHRYPEAFNQFRPSLTDEPDKSDHDPANQQLVNNAYDNSVLYTDYVLEHVIELLKGTEARSGLYYVSDHGENIFDGACPLTGHGSSARLNYPVSALAWLSDAYIRRFPDALVSLQRNAGKPLSTENTFDSLADLAHLDYRGADSAKSVFSSGFEARPRLVNVNAGAIMVNWDRARFVGDCERPSATD